MILGMFRKGEFMGKVIYTLLFWGLCCLMLVSCKEEPLNAECDIEQVTVHCPDPGVCHFGRVTV